MLEILGVELLMNLYGDIYFKLDSLLNVGLGEFSFNLFLLLLLFSIVYKVFKLLDKWK